MERLASAFFGGPEAARVTAGVFPLVNLSEDKDNYFARAELPGIKAEAIDIQVLGRNLTISGQRQIPFEGENVRYHRREREAGKFSRAIALPGEIDGDKVKAQMVNGLLTITIPKAQAAKPRQIAVS
jgi:HSP20 family protein